MPRRAQVTISLVQTTGKSSKKIVRSLFLFVGFLVVVFILHRHAINPQLYWDDTSLIFHSRALDVSSPLSFWVRGTHDTKAWPLSFTLLWVMHSAFDQNVIAYKVLLLFLHSVTAFAFYFLLRRMRFSFAIWGALIFLVHPLHVETLSWIMQINAVLSCLFLILTTHAVLDFLRRREKSSYVVSWLSFLASVASKSHTLLFPILFFFLFRRRYRFWQSIFLVLPFFILSVYFGFLAIVGVFSFEGERSYARTYFYPGPKITLSPSQSFVLDRGRVGSGVTFFESRTFDLSRSGSRVTDGGRIFDWGQPRVDAPGPQRELALTSGMQKAGSYIRSALEIDSERGFFMAIDRVRTKLAAAGRNYFFYVGKFLYPVEQKAIYPPPVAYAAYWEYLFLLLSIGAIVFCLRLRRSFSTLHFGQVLGFLCFLPVSGLFYVAYMKYAVVADRWTYVLSVGFVICALSALRQVENWGRAAWIHKAIRVLLIVVVFSLGARTYIYSQFFNTAPAGLIIPHGTE